MSLYYEPSNLLKALVYFLIICLHYPVIFYLTHLFSFLFHIQFDYIYLQDNGSKLLENRWEPTINWTAHNKDSFEILRKAVRDKDPEAGKIIVEQVPEFKNMMDEIAEIGAIGAKKYIKHLESEIKNLEGTKDKYNEDVEHIYNDIQKLIVKNL